jgi:hypothetical protein
MVWDFIQRFNGTDGAVITVANSSGGTNGDAFSSLIFNSGTDVSTAGNAFFTYSTAAALEGTAGAKFTTSGVTGNSYALKTFPAGNGKRAVVRFPLNIPSAPAALYTIMRISSPTTFFQLILTTSRQLNAYNGSTGIAASGAGVLAVNTQYWVEYAVTIGTTTSNGVLEYKVFTNSATDGSGTDTLVTSWSSGATLNTGTDADFGGGSFRMQSPLSTSGWTSLNTDLWRARVTTDTAGFLGPYVSTLPPTAAVTGTVPKVILTATPTGGVSPYTYGITHMSGPSLTSDAVLTPNNDNRWTVPVPTGSDDVWRILITDANGSTSDPADFTVTKAVGGAPAIVEKQWDAGSSTWITL